MVVGAYGLWPRGFMESAASLVSRLQQGLANQVIKLWHDDVRPAPEGWMWARTNAQAQAILESAWPVEEISMDHDLGFHGVEIPDDPDEFLAVMQLKGDEEEGTELVEWMIANDRVPPRITIHSWNPDGARRMARLFHGAGHSVTIQPFAPLDA